MCYSCVIHVINVNLVHICSFCQYFSLYWLTENTWKVFVFVFFSWVFFFCFFFVFLLDYINFALWLILNLTTEQINENKQGFFLEQIYVRKTKVGLFCYLNVDI